MVRELDHTISLFHLGSQRTAGGIHHTQNVGRRDQTLVFAESQWNDTLHNFSVVDDLQKGSDCEQNSFHLHFRMQSIEGTDGVHSFPARDTESRLHE